MANYLVIKGLNDNIRNYELYNQSTNKPYLEINNKFLDLYEIDDTGGGIALNIKINGKNYRPLQTSSSSEEYATSSTYTSTDSYHTTTRQSSYTESYKVATSTYYGKQTITTSYITRYTTLYTSLSYADSACGDNAANDAKTRAASNATHWNGIALAVRVSTLSNVQGSTVMSYIGAKDANAGARGHKSYLLPRNVTSATVNNTSYYYAPVHPSDVAVGTVSHKWTGYNSTLIYNYIYSSACNANGNSCTNTATATGAVKCVNGVSLLSTLTKVTNTGTASAQTNYTRSSTYTDYYYTQTTNYTTTSSISTTYT